MAGAKAGWLWWLRPVVVIAAKALSAAGLLGTIGLVSGLRIQQQRRLRTP